MVKPSDELRSKMKQRARELQARADEEYAIVLDHILERFPEVSEHPALPRLVRRWWQHLALDLPADWAAALPERCSQLFNQPGWILPQLGDGVHRGVTTKRCRSLLGSIGEAHSESEIRFLREQLYSLAELVIDRLASEQGGAK